jgi:hypothetical protein
VYAALKRLQLLVWEASCSHAVEERYQTITVGVPLLLYPFSTLHLLLLLLLLLARSGGEISNNT